MGAIRASLGPVRLAGAKLWGFYDAMRQYEYELICSGTHFVLQISWPPLIAQKWFCIQNVRMDLSFQEKKTIGKSDIWLPR